MTERIIELMRERDWNAADLSRATALSEGAISNILSGKRRQPRSDTLTRIAKALDTTTDYLTGASDNPFADRSEPLPDYALSVIAAMKRMGRARNYELMKIAEAFVEAEAQVNALTRENVMEMLLDAAEEIAGAERVDLLTDTLGLLEKKWGNLNGGTLVRS